MMRGRRGGGEERRGLNRCEWVLADLTADLQEPLAHARAPELKKIGRRGAGIFLRGARIFLDAFLEDAYFFCARPTHFWKIRRAHSFPRAIADAGDSRSRARRRTPRRSG
jgi:hypothetical protein